MSIPIYEPLNTLKKVAENIWIADGEIIKMNVFSVGIPFSTRMTVVKLKDGTLWCHSPIKSTPALLEEIDQLGEVRHLVSPNKIHYAYIGEWQKHYPNAIAWASPGVEDRAASQNMEVSFDFALENEPPSGWRNEIDQLLFQGGRVVQEVVFFHKSSRTLILADLIENFEPKRTDNRFWRAVYRLAGIADPDGKMPIDYRMSFFGRKDQARESLRQILAWAPEKTILAHGRWYKENGTQELKRAFRWLL